MLIHGDGNSNVVQDSMFNRAKWIEDSDINIVLMNPPIFIENVCDIDYTKMVTIKRIHLKVFIAVEWVNTFHHIINSGITSIQAAIGNSGDVKVLKRNILDNYTLDAVFSLPR